MNRRNFILKGLFTAIAVGTSIGSVLANIVWVKPGGSVQYKEKASDSNLKAGRKCSNCKHYKDDKKVKDAGLCTLKAVTKVPAYVKKDGYCTMFTKRAKT